jgi:hypothetical protein
MGVLRTIAKAIAYAFIALFAILLLLGFVGYLYYVNQMSRLKPQLIMNQPAGLAYNGPNTTALAGYYCIEGINSSGGYSIQLNAMLSNELWVQSTYKPSVFSDDVWSNTLLYLNNLHTINTPCAWLIIALRNGTAYFGYSLDGRHVVWYGSYPVNTTYIIASPSTDIVLVGTGNETLAQLGNGTTLIHLALYYWNGTSWEPAPVSVFTTSASGTIIYTGAVNHAYVYTSGECSGIVSWPNPLNNTQCPAPPSFTPQPRPQPILVANQPAGLAYNGPGTTALAGYYCIVGLNSSNGFSIQLNAELSNGLWIQDVYGTASNNSVSLTSFWTNVWKNQTMLHARGTSYRNATCAWLIMALNNGYAYFGYSFDGKNVIWYDEYPVGNASIISSYETGIALAGYGNGARAQLGNGTLVYLVLYYWNGTDWLPAPVNPGGYLTAETVNHAWVFTNGTCSGYAAWFGWNSTNPSVPALPTGLEPICPMPSLPSPSPPPSLLNNNFYVYITVVNDTVDVYWQVSSSNEGYGSNSNVYNVKLRIVGPMDILIASVNSTSLYECTISPSSVIVRNGTHYTFTVNCFYKSPPHPLSVTKLVTNAPAGIEYVGPPTTALAGYYCIEGIGSSNGYSIQLSAMLSNGVLVQNSYGTFVEESVNGGPWVTYTALSDSVWSMGASPQLIHGNNPGNDIVNAPCAWLITALRNGVVYFGYSLDGRSINWYDSYPVNASYIVPTTLGYTNIALGSGNGEEAQLSGDTLVYLSLYYWNGTGWAPAPVTLAGQYATGEAVNHAYIYTDGSCGGVVSWPNPVNNTQCPVPGFEP